MVIKGKVVEGLGESSHFTDLPWVREQFRDKLGIDPYPGTLNLEVSGEDLVTLNKLKKRRGIEIVPPAGFCPAKCFPVLVGAKVKGAIVIPVVAGYPESKLEIIAAVGIRDALALEIGDSAEVKIL